jgi:tryptophan synthase alpha chain
MLVNLSGRGDKDVPAYRGAPGRAAMNGIVATFERIRRSATPGFVAYVTAGDPGLPETAAILRALPAAGADVIEVGVPFSDPVADGPVIQRASERALRAGATLTSVIDMVREVRGDVAAPIVLFTYANPVERLGREAFVTRAAAAGIDGVLVVDLPIDEAEGLASDLTGRGIAPIFLVSPTTPAARVARAAALGSGFLYAISRLGVTGARNDFSADAAAVMETIRAVTSMPVALGFGIAARNRSRPRARWRTRPSWAARS